MTKRRLALIIISLASLSLGSVIFLKERKTGPSNPQTQTYTVKRGKITHYTEQTGIVKAQVGAIVKVGTRASGEIVELNYQVGDFVKKGALIARIDSRELEAARDEILAQIEEQKRDIEAKEAIYDYAKKDYERELLLFSKELTTKESLDRAKRDMDTAYAQLQVSKARLKSLEERLNSIKIRLSYYSIYAPISGYVSEISTQKGETVVAGLSAVNLITIIDTSKLEMWIYVDETDIGRTKPGMKVEYWVDAYKNLRFKGRIKTIYPQPQVMNNIVYYPAIVKIDPEYATYLKPEMTTRVRIIVEEKENVILCPNESIRFEEGRYVVYVKKNGDVEKRPVKIGIRDENYTEIISGLAEGETILLSPFPKKPATHMKPQRKV